MPRQRLSLPVIKRARLRTISDVNNQFRKLYHLLENGKLSDIVTTRRINIFIALRNGMSETSENTDFEPATFNIFSIPTNHFFSGDQLKLLSNNEPIVTLNQCTPLDIDQTNAPPQIEHVEQTPAPEPPSVEIDELTRQRNSHFRPEFHYVTPLRPLDFGRRRARDSDEVA